MRRVPFSARQSDDYIAERAAAPCFICEIAAGGARRKAHEMVYEDDQVIAFLTSGPTHYGQTLVCPKRHVVDVVGGLALDEYLYLQRIVYAVGRAVEQVVAPERIYIACFGSHQVNAHVHFHVHPLPPGVPVREQQMVSMQQEAVGRLELTQVEWDYLGQRIRAAVQVV